MLVFLEIQIAQRLLGASRNSLGAGKFGHQQAAMPQPTNHAAKQRVRNAGHRRQDGRRPDDQITHFVFRWNHGFLRTELGTASGSRQQFSHSKSSPVFGISGPFSFKYSSMRKNLRPSA